MPIVRFTFRELLLLANERQSAARFALYISIAKEGGTLSLFEWNNRGRPLDDDAVRPLDDDFDHWNVIDVELADAITLRMDAYSGGTKDWPNAATGATHLGGRTFQCDATKPDTLGVITLGPTTTSQSLALGYQVVATVAVVAPPKERALRIHFENLLLLDNDQSGQPYVGLHAHILDPIPTPVFHWFQRTRDVRNYGLATSAAAIVNIKTTKPVRLHVALWGHGSVREPSSTQHQRDLGQASIVIDASDSRTIGHQKLGPALHERGAKSYEVNVRIEEVDLEIHSLRIDGVEATQGVQHFRSALGADNSLELVAMRDTLVRVYLDSGFAEEQGITGKVTLLGPNGAVGEVEPLEPFVALPQHLVDRRAMSTTLNFLLPGHVCVGAVELQVDVFRRPAPDREPLQAEPYLMHIAFIPTRQLEILRVLIKDGSVAALSPHHHARVVNQLTHLFPIPSSPALAIKQWFSGTDALENRWDLTLDLGLLLLVTDVDDRQDDFDDNWVKAHGLMPSAIGADRMGWQEYQAAISFSNLQSSVGHELGHAYGLDHAPCGGPDHPDKHFVPSSGHTGELGVALLPSLRTFMPELADFMSYCDNDEPTDTIDNWQSEQQWIGGYHWTKLLRHFEVK
jgi:hypothetical protein